MKKKYEATKSHSSKVTAKCDVGFKNALYIRGTGAGLSWERGKLMKNTGTDSWVWETDVPFKDCEFKVLVNDQVYEDGENHHLSNGKTVEFKPNFKS